MACYQWSRDCDWQGDRQHLLMAPPTTTEKPAIDDEQPLTKKERYGWLSWRPDCVQWMNGISWFMVYVCIACFTQTMCVNGLIGVSLSTIETRYNLQSSQVTSGEVCNNSGIILRWKINKKKVVCVCVTGQLDTEYLRVYRDTSAHSIGSDSQLHQQSAMVGRCISLHRTGVTALRHATVPQWHLPVWQSGGSGPDRKSVV